MQAAEKRAHVGTWTIDAAHSEVSFSVRHMVFATVRGRFPDIEGSLVLNEDRPSESTITVRLGAASVDTNNAQRDAHLRSADFFDAERYADLTFTSTRVEPLGGPKYRVTGDLTIHGVTREVVLAVEETGRGKDPWGNNKIGFTAAMALDRKDYGLTWNQALETGGVLVSDEVKIAIDVQVVGS